MMKLKKNAIYSLILLMLLIGFNKQANAISTEEEHLEKGPNNGRLLKDDDFSIELAIFENGMPPEFRVFAAINGNSVNLNELEVVVRLIRLGNKVDTIDFTVADGYLKGDMEVYEPHSFKVELDATYQGKLYQWSYDNFEGRTQIDDDTAQAIGIKTETVASRALSDEISVYGVLKSAPNAVSKVTAPYDGRVMKLNAELGQSIKKGELLLTVKSNESLQSYNVYSPITGIITHQNVSLGEQTNERELLVITDPAQLIAELKVFPMQREKVQKGAKVTIGKVTSTIFDSLYQLEPQQAKIFRAKIDNSEGELSPGQFVKASIEVATYEVDLAVRKEALQAFRDFTVVYAKVGDDYEVRMLELGRQSGGWIEVLGGIEFGTEYVTENSYIIKADIEKSGASHDH